MGTTELTDVGGNMPESSDVASQASSVAQNTSVDASITKTKKQVDKTTAKMNNDAESVGNAVSNDLLSNNTNMTNEVTRDGAKPNMLQKAVAINAGASVAGTLSTKMLLMRLRDWLMGMLASLQQAIMGMVHAFLAFVQTVATLIGVSIMTVVTSMVSGIIVIGVVVIAIVVNVVTSENVARSIDVPIDCSVNVDKVIDGAVIDADIASVANAQMIYSAMSVYGIPDVNIAGILGNWDVETGIDPSKIESLYGEEYNPYGSKHINAYNDLNSYTLNVVFPSYKISINRNAYIGSDGKYYCGLGLGQWTGPAAYNLITFAKNNGYSWYDLDLQLMYCMATNGYRSGWLSTWTAPELNARTAASVFATKWEGHKTTDKRESKAEYWAVLMASWNVDVDYGQSIIEAAGTVAMDGTNNAVTNATNKCKSVRVYDNSTLARAAVSYAYENTADSVNNDGTPLYRSVHDSIFPTDTHYQSCDRGVACAVRWSGTDDTYPVGDTYRQLQYLVNSSKWEEVTDWNGDYNNLVPGDVLIRVDSEVRHTVLFVGNDIIGDIYPDKAGNPDYNNVAASLNERSPACCMWYTGSEGLNTYRAFRNVKKETDSVYKQAHIS